MLLISRLAVLSAPRLRRCVACVSVLAVAVSTAWRCSRAMGAMGLRLHQAQVVVC
jgi:hypothetical protein